MKLFPSNLKNCFGKAAARTINDLARWVNNFAQGFGIKVERLDKGVAVGINPEDTDLCAWIKDVATSANTESKVEVENNKALDNTEVWNRKMNKNLEIWLPCSFDTTYNGDPDQTAFVMKKFTFSTNGTIISVSDRSIKLIYGQS